MQILMLGNSFTSANDLPALLAQQLDAQVLAHTRGGARLSEHLNPSTRMGQRTQEALASRRFDYVVLQEMSNGPITSRRRFLESSRQLCACIREAGAVPVFYATWAYQAGSDRLAAIGLSYEDMTRQLAEAYAEAARQGEALLAPVGLRFAEEAASRQLYARDGAHPSSAGTALAAETLAAVILAHWESR